MCGHAASGVSHPALWSVLWRRGVYLVGRTGTCSTGWTGGHRVVSVSHPGSAVVDWNTDACVLTQPEVLALPTRAGVSVGSTCPALTTTARRRIPKRVWAAVSLVVSSEPMAGNHQVTSTGAAEERMNSKTRTGASSLLGDHSTVGADELSQTHTNLEVARGITRNCYAL